MNSLIQQLNGSGYVDAVCRALPNQARIKEILYNPALIAAGVQSVGFISLQSMAGVMTAADAVFQYVSRNNLNLSKRADELVVLSCRFSVLTLMADRLFTGSQISLLLLIRVGQAAIMKISKEIMWAKNKKFLLANMLLTIVWVSYAALSALFLFLLIA
ncbi:MAG: hypothetical protein LVR00_04640 [Rhabdochlamydiaceae bacterium]